MKTTKTLFGHTMSQILVEAQGRNCVNLWSIKGGFRILQIVGQTADFLILTSKDKKIAGITPDQPFRWRMELMFNRITEVFSENARIEHAKERLAESKVMLQQNKF